MEALRRVQPWFASLLAASVAQHAALGVLRPMLSYRALEIGVEPAFLGLVAAAFALVPLAVALPVGRLVDRGHETRYALLGTLGMLAGALGLIGNHSIPALVICSISLGLGHLAIIVSMQALVATASDTERYDRRFAHLGLAAAFGQLIGPALGGWAAGDGSSEGVSMAFAVGAGLSLVSVPFMVGMRSGDKVMDRSLNRLGDPQSLVAILRSPGMASAMLASLTVGSAIDVLQVYLPALGQAAGWSPGAVGALLATRAAASMVSRVVLGRLVDRFGRARLLASSMGIAAAAIVALALVQLELAFVAMTIAGLALGMGQPLTLSAVATQAERGTQATALSVRLMGNRVGQVAVPVSAGLVAGVAGVAGVIALTGIAVGLSTWVVVMSGVGGSTGHAPHRSA